MTGLHDQNGHAGVDRMYQVARTRYFFLGSYVFIKNHVLTCLACQSSKRPIHKERMRSPWSDQTPQSTGDEKNSSIVWIIVRNWVMHLTTKQWDTGVWSGWLTPLRTIGGLGSIPCTAISHFICIGIQQAEITDDNRFITRLKYWWATTKKKNRK